MQYLRLVLAASSGFGDNRNTVFVQASFFDEAAQRILKAKVKEGSLLEITGHIKDIGAYPDKESGELRTFISLHPYAWEYAPASKNKSAADDGSRPQRIDTPARSLPSEPVERITCPVGHMPY